MKINVLDWIMLIILLAMEIPATTFLVLAWVRACNKTKDGRKNSADL